MRQLTLLNHLRPRWRLLLATIAVGGVVLAVSVPMAVSAATSARPVAHQSASPCTATTCHFKLKVNPGLLSGTFACPAIQHATASISVTNRFARDALNDVMTLSASGLPPKTGFDLFLVQNSPLDANFTGFGFGWYQSDVESDSSGNASVTVRGIFDDETFIENPSSPTTPVHTFNVGFWFDSPSHEASKCHTSAPAATPFNGEQDAGLLAMITAGEPLGLVK